MSCEKTFEKRRSLGCVLCSPSTVAFFTERERVFESDIIHPTFIIYIKIMILRHYSLNRIFFTAHSFSALALLLILSKESRIA